jgi:hypothetical protein
MAISPEDRTRFEAMGVELVRIDLLRAFEGSMIARGTDRQQADNHDLAVRHGRTIMREWSLQGMAWRWQHSNQEQIEICAEREADDGD